MIAPEAAASFLRVEPCEMSEEGGGREEDAGAGVSGVGVRERSDAGEKKRSSTRRSNAE